MPNFKKIKFNLPAVEVCHKTPQGITFCPTPETTPEMEPSTGPETTISPDDGVVDSGTLDVIPNDDGDLVSL